MNAYQEYVDGKIDEYIAIKSIKSIPKVVKINTQKIQTILNTEYRNYLINKNNKSLNKYKLYSKYLNHIINRIEYMEENVEEENRKEFNTNYNKKYSAELLDLVYPDQYKTSLIYMDLLMYAVNKIEYKEIINHIQKMIYLSNIVKNNNAILLLQFFLDLINYVEENIYKENRKEFFRNYIKENKNQLKDIILSSLSDKNGHILLNVNYNKETVKGLENIKKLESSL